MYKRLYTLNKLFYNSNSSGSRDSSHERIEHALVVQCVVCILLVGDTNF